MAFIDSLAGAYGKTSKPIMKRVSNRLALWRSRRDLAKLDARQLEDIGVTPDAARREANLGIWDVPHTWQDR